MISIANHLNGEVSGFAFGWGVVCKCANVTSDISRNVKENKVKRSQIHEKKKIKEFSWAMIFLMKEIAQYPQKQEVLNMESGDLDESISMTLTNLLQFFLTWF